MPYLLGTLPKGVNPRTARDQDYVYNRELTEEERRARFLYWGKAPKFVSEGLPKFDGKHFYPPSPVKERSVSPNIQGMNLGLTTSQLQKGSLTPSEYGSPTPRNATMPVVDPFRPITPVQKLGQSKVAGEDEYSGFRHVNPYNPRTIGVSEDLQMMSDLVGIRDTGAAPKIREHSTDAVSLGYQDRRSERSGGPKLWQSVLKKGSAGSALSSMAAQGYLPNYSGHAAASLSPSVGKTAVLPSHEISSPGISDRSDGGAMLTSPPPERRSENLPPGALGSLEDQFKNISIGSERRDLSTLFPI